jgi:hypothetical protein
VQVLPKQQIAVIVKIADQIVLILNHQVPALVLHLQRKHVASEVSTALLNPPNENTPRVGYSWLYYDKDH